MPDWQKSFEQVVEFPAGATDTALAAIPAKRGVILLSTSGDEPILLLPAADVRARVRNRLRNPDEEERRRLPNLQEITGKAYWKLSGGHFETDLDYLELARAIWPKTYTTMLAWKPAWFCHVDAAGPCPMFQRTRDVFRGPGQWLGPFPDGRACEKFIDLLNDAFDLCREPQCLRRAPHAERCAYAQMNRCRIVCDGTMPMDEYRLVVAQAAEFALGLREPWKAELARQMKQAAESLQFERASVLKGRLQRLGEFDNPGFRFVAAAGDFQFLLVQPWSRRQAKVFCASRGRIFPFGVLDWPLQSSQVEAATAKMANLAAEAPAGASEDLWRMGLVSHYLFVAPGRQGLMLRYRPGLTAGDVFGAVSAAKDLLGLKDPKPRGVKKPPREGDENV